MSIFYSEVLFKDGLSKDLLEYLSNNDLICEEILWRQRLFELGNVVVLSRSDAIEMTVGVIKVILIRNNECYLLVRRFLAEKSFFHVFDSTDCDLDLVFINIENLHDTYPLLRRGKETKFSVILHHHISFSYC